MARAPRRSGSSFDGRPWPRRGQDRQRASNKQQFGRIQRDCRCAARLRLLLLTAYPPPNLFDEGLTKREKIEDPSQDKRDDEELAKDLQAIDELLSIRPLGNGAEHNTGQYRKEGHPENVPHCFLPAAISNASSM